MAIAFSTTNVVMRGGPLAEFNQWRPPNAPRKRSMPQTSPPGLGSFTPPHLGFGNPSRRVIERNDSEKKSMVEELRGKVGPWQRRAKFVWELQQLGVTAEELYEDALISPEMQTVMVVASKVLESMEEGSPELLSTFEDESQVSTLYALRTLSVKQRKAAGEFVSKNNLDPREAEVLARAIKTHERRAEHREGFLPVPGDCLALMHYRAATESSELDKKLEFAQQAMQVAVSDVAKAKIQKVLDGL